MNRPLVLVVDDDADLRELVALTLVDAGVDVDEAANGREALIAVERRRPNLVLLDLMMPVMDGETFNDELRKRASPPPVVVMTAADSAAARASDLGAVGWLAKPFDIDELVEVVRAHLEGAPHSNGGGGRARTRRPRARARGVRTSRADDEPSGQTSKSAFSRISRTRQRNVFAATPSTIR